MPHLKYFCKTSGLCDIGVTTINQQIQRVSLSAVLKSIHDASR